MKHDLTTWDLFVLRHTKVGNLVVHFISFIMFWVSPVVALVTLEPWWLLLFFASGAVGAAGHHVFKDSGVSLKEATTTPGVPLYVGIMFYKLARGRYWDDVRVAREKLARVGAVGVEDLL